MGEFNEDEEGFRIKEATKSEAEMGRSREAPPDVSVPAGMLCAGPGAGGPGPELRRLKRLALRALGSGFGDWDAEGRFGL